MNQDLQQCVQECTQCHRSCLEAMHYCLLQGGAYADPEHIRLLTDCAEICQTSANFMLRDSDLHMLINEACAEICQQCWESFNHFNKDAQMKQWAADCRRCSETCQQMVS